MSGRFWVILILSFVATTLVVARVVVPRVEEQNSEFRIQNSENFQELIVGGAQLQVAVADDDAERNQGLSGKTLGEDEGMLFVFPEARRYGFWMGGMLIPLDFVWIADGKVVDIHENVPFHQEGEQPASLAPGVPVTHVLEVNAGWVEKNGIEIGDEVRF